jgi:hypothetical protein
MSKATKVVHISEDEILHQLGAMEQDDGLNTPPENNDGLVPTGQEMSFSQKHFTYLRTHPKVNPEFYLSNLRAMIKIRS